MTVPDVILPGSVLGVLGGGQLGRMFAIAAAQMGYRVIAYTPERDSPVSHVSSKTYVASFEDTDSLRAFARDVSVVTIEFENIPAAALETLQAYTLVRPGPTVLHITQNRLREKEFLAANKFPIVPFRKVTTANELPEAARALGTPLVLKTAGFGYDGKGQQLIESVELASQVRSLPEDQEAVVESFIKYEKEVSVIGARTAGGAFAAFGPVENKHRNHILDVSVAPARIGQKLKEEAFEITRSIMEIMDVVGLLCVEFFVTSEESLLINELAPRPHNSGHYSIEACPASQFEQQVRAITGLSLGETQTQGWAAMANLLGDLWGDGEPDWERALSLPAVHLHLYGKSQPRAGRKMGHITALGASPDEAIERVESARELLASPRKFSLEGSSGSKEALS